MEQNATETIIYAASRAYYDSFFRIQTENYHFKSI